MCVLVTPALGARTGRPHRQAKMRRFCLSKRPCSESKESGKERHWPSCSGFWKCVHLHTHLHAPHTKENQWPCVVMRSCNPNTWEVTVREDQEFRVICVSYDHTIMLGPTAVLLFSHSPSLHGPSLAENQPLTHLRGKSQVAHLNSN